MGRKKNKQVKANAELHSVARLRLSGISWIALIIIILFAGYLRLRLIGVPLERDEGEYAYAGQLILQGVPPYSEVYNMKLPGIYGIYALLLAVFGQTHQGIHFGLLVVNSVTIIFVYLLAKRLLNSLAAIVSAGAFSILSLSQSVQGIFANAEHFVIVFSVAGLLVMLKALADKSHLKLFAAGILLCLGFLMKQHGVMFCILAMLYIILDGLLHKPVSWKLLLLRVLSLSAGFVTVFGCLLLTMAWCGVFREFWFWTVKYARTYVSQVPIAYAGGFLLDSFSYIFASAPLLWIFACLGIIAILITKQINRSYKIFLLLLTLFSFLAICPGFIFRQHYFILLLAGVALLCGGVVYILSHWLSFILPNRFSHSIPVIILIAGIGQSVYLQSDYLFRMTPFEVSRSTYGACPFPESLPIADFIRDHTTPEDTIAILGSEPQIFFYAKRRSSSGYIYMYPLMEQHEYALQMQKDFIRQTEEKEPKYVVAIDLLASWLYNRGSHKVLTNWKNEYLQTKYRLVGTIELFDYEAKYHWYPQVKWPLSSQYSVLVFERNDEQ